jgi:hypothetical protein
LFSYGVYWGKGFEAFLENLGKLGGHIGQKDEIDEGGQKEHWQL